ncbi:MAG: DUF4124 domain-containing protein [Burkholderiales bacterium]
MVRRRIPLAAAALALGCAACALPATAALYKWVDANGRIVYSDQPPPTNIKSEIVQGAPPPVNPNAAKDLAAKDLEFKKRQTDAADKEKKAESQRVEVAKKNEQCTRAQIQMKQLGAEQIGLVRYNEKGEVVYVDDATRRRERVELEAWFRQNCAPS